MSARSPSEAPSNNATKFYNRVETRREAQNLLEKKVISEIRAMANQKKVTKNSYMIIAQRLERNLQNILNHVDPQQTQRLTFGQLGHVFTVLKIFKVVKFDENANCMSNPSLPI